MSKYTEQEFNNLGYIFSVSIKENATNRQAVAEIMNLEAKVMKKLEPFYIKPKGVEDELKQSSEPNRTTKMANNRKKTNLKKAK